MPLLELVLAVLPVLLLAMGFCPPRLVDRNCWLSRVVQSLVFVQFLLAVVLCGVHLSQLVWQIQLTEPEATVNWLPGFSTYYDGVASLMLTLVSFVGWVICVYSVRYLDGEQQQGQFFSGVGFTIGAVSLMVISGNLIAFSLAWMLTSWGLHRLLLFYADRPAAQRAAWTKFAISRLGDAAICGALVLLYIEFRTLDLPELFAAVLAGDPTLRLHAANMLLVIGAITKSAQFPFHTWLPLTMETPTPVSALMHAGVVNAGGYLMIRTSPLVAQTPWALTALALIGGFTACFAAVTMMTQTSIKKKLAYSTIAQMGFMLLQCGLGAYSAALLHILAHSLYKAYAFLSSGSVLQQRSATLGAVVAPASALWLRLVLFATIPASSLAVGYAVLGIDLSSKPGGWLLASLFVVAFANWITQVSLGPSRMLMGRVFLASGLLCLTYVGSYALVDALIASSLPAAAGPAMASLVVPSLIISFAAVFCLSTQVMVATPSRWTQRLYVHCANGLYVESFLRRAWVPCCRVLSGR